MKKKESKGVKSKATERKLRRGINWQGALKQTGVKKERETKHWCNFLQKNIFPFPSIQSL